MHGGFYEKKEKVKVTLFSITNYKQKHFYLFIYYEIATLMVGHINIYIDRLIYFHSTVHHFHQFLKLFTLPGQLFTHNYGLMAFDLRNYC